MPTLPSTLLLWLTWCVATLTVVYPVAYQCSYRSHCDAGLTSVVTLLVLWWYIWLLLIVTVLRAKRWLLQL